jgi:hypothetical protein
MRNSEHYAQQAEAVMRLAAKAESRAEREVYLNIAEGWRRLAAEAIRTEQRRHEHEAWRGRSEEGDEDRLEA